MTTQTLTLKATPREPGGKLANARAKGLLPGVLYGNKTEAISVFMDRIEFQKIHKVAGSSTIVSVQYDGKNIPTLIHAVGYDTILRIPEHVDFLLVDALHTMRATVPVEFVGEAPAIKSYKATLVKNIHEIEVEAMADKLPHSVTVDTSTLAELGDLILVSDIILPVGVQATIKPDTVVASLDKEQIDEVVPETPVTA